MTFEEMTKGIPLRDAKNPINLKIRRQDIDGAVDRNPENCVVARSVKRSFNGSVAAVKIGAQFAYVYDGKQVLRYRLSSETKDMIRAYDSAGFYPTGVPAKLLPVCKSQRLGNGKPQGGPKKDTGKPRSKTRPFLRHIQQSTA